MFFKKNITFSENDLASIIDACISNDVRAQRELFKQFFGFGKSICLRYASNHEEAEDILNEGFLKVFQNLEKYDKNQPFKAWFRTILVNTAISSYRKNSKFGQNVGYEEVSEPGFDDTILEKISADEILKSIQQLPEQFKAVFLMYVVDGYSHKEIADILEMNEATVRSNFSRARLKLQLIIKNTHPYLFPQEWDSNKIKYNEN